MNVEIIDKPLRLTIHGFSGKILNKDYVGTAFKLMDRMWKIVNSEKLKNKGLNIWVYDQNDNLFAGVELEETPNHDTGLEQKTIELLKYASYKHIGPYQLVNQATRDLMDELKRMGVETGWPYIEIYGHHNNDESKLETELLVNIK